MKRFLCLVLLLICCSCNSVERKENSSTFDLTISSTVDQEAQINQEIIKTLRGFLSTKNESNDENAYWSSSDFDTYWFPYQDIYRIESKDSIVNFYQPTLLHIVDTDEENKKLIKVAYIGHNTDTEENTLKYIYNIVATKSDSGVVFSNPTQYFTQDWEKIEKGSLHYIISPNKEFNEQEAQKQIKDIEKISAFFDTEPLPITYYSCTNVKELFQIKGFDYNPIMYREGGGGLSARQNIVFSANSSEFYTHEIMHLYIIAFYDSRAQLFNEGMATYFGGSSGYSYNWHKKNLKTFLTENPEIDLSLHLEPFERFFAGETSIPYMIGALICERTFRLYGKEKLLALLEKGDKWELLNDVGLTKENLNSELRKELQLPPTSPMHHGGFAGN